jgi:hypothetical protein
MVCSKGGDKGFTDKKWKKNGKDYEDKDDKEERRKQLMKNTDDQHAEARGPLGGGTFVVTGVFENITRDKIEEFIKTNGGRLCTGVSGKTDYLVVGHLLDDNRPVMDGSKYKRAVQLGKKIMTEREFEQFCKTRFDNPDFVLGRKRKKDTTGKSGDTFVPSGQGNSLDDMVDIDKFFANQEVIDLESTSNKSTLRSKPKSVSTSESTPSKNVLTSSE